MERNIQMNTKEFIIDFAKNICSFPTPRGEERKIASYIAERFENLGIEVELQDVVDGRPNVVAIIRGDQSYKSFLFNGHLDMPMPFGTWKADPFKPWVEDDKIYGAGITDMRSGNVAIMTAVALLKDSLPKKHGDVIVAFTMHHDTIGLGLKYFLNSCEWKIDAGLCAEPTDSKLQLAHGGAWDWQIELNGVTRHQCQIEEAVDTITGMVKIVQRLNKKVLTYTPDPEMPYLPLLHVGVVQGGRGYSMVADNCCIKGDIRYLKGMTVDGMKRDIQRVIDEVCAEMPLLKAKLSTMAFQWPYQIEKDEPITLLFREAYRETIGKEVEITKGLPSGAFITDGADMMRCGIPTIFYGPSCWRCEPNEFARITDIEKAANVFMAFSRKIISQPRLKKE